MVYKKYIKRGGRTYGPYYYESFREDGKVKKRYIKNVEQENFSDGLKSFNFKKTFYFVGVILLFGIVILALFTLQSNRAFSGRAALSVDSNYLPGEQLNGNLKLTLKSGELIPKDSKLIVDINGESREFSISELLTEDVAGGNFFVENVGISGAGEGYGIAGEKASYPTVDFELLISDGQIAGNETVVNETIPSVPETPSTPETSSNETIPTVPETEVPVSPEVPATETPTTPTTPETPAIETPGSEVPATPGTETPATPAGETPAVPSTETPSTETPTTPTTPEIPAAEVASPETQGSGITGGAISENSQNVKGKVSKDKEFSYAIEKKQSASIVAGSVSFNGSAIGDDKINLKVNANEARVSTDYSIVENGFGAEFLGNKNLQLNIDIGKLGLNATAGSLKISVVYENATIVSVEEEIKVVGKKPVLNETTGLNETIVNKTIVEVVGNISLVISIPTIRLNANDSYALNLNDYFSGAERYEFNVANIISSIDGSSLVIKAEEGFKGSRIGKVIAYAGNESLESNEFLILVSSGIMNVRTSRGKIEVGKPVNWIKNITLEKPEEVRLELPKEAENIKIARTDSSGNEVVKSVGISGNIVAELDVKKKGLLPRLFGAISRMFAGITGRAVEDINASVLSGNNSGVEVVLSDNVTNYVIQYQTPAPESREEGTSNGKRIVISGPDGLNYSDVIASTNLSDRVSVVNANNIKIYWRNYDYSNSAGVKEVSDVENETITEESSSGSGGSSGNGANNTISSNSNSEIVNNSVSGNIVNSSISGENSSSIDNSVSESNSSLSAMGNSSIQSGITGSAVSEAEGGVSGSLNNESNAGETISNESAVNVNESIVNESAVNVNGLANNSINGLDSVGAGVAVSETLTDENGIKYMRQEVPFDAYDLNGDGKVDYIEWVVPHLSNQTFDIIEISKAEHLDSAREFIEDVYESVKAQDGNYTTVPDGDYVRVTFARPLDKTRDITIYARISCPDNSSVLINGIDVPCEIFKKKLRLDALRRQNG